MKSINEMSYRELVEELQYVVSLLDEQPHYHEAYVADLAEELLKRAKECAA